MSEALSDEIKLMVEKLRRKADKALTESLEAAPVFEKIVLGIEAKTKHPENRRFAARALSQRVLFFTQLETFHKEVSEGIAETSADFKKLQQEVVPVLQNLPPLKAEPTIEDKLKLFKLESELKSFVIRRDVALTIIEAPMYAAIVGMNDATKILLGETRRFSIDYAQLRKDAAKFVVGIVAPGSGEIMSVLKQFQNRVSQAASELVDSISDSDRLYQFSDYARISLEILGDWRAAAGTAISDMHKLTNSDFRKFVEELRSLS